MVVQKKSEYHCQLVLMIQFAQLLKKKMVTLQDMRNWKKTKIHNVYIGKYVLLPQLLNFLFQNVKNSHLGIHAHNSVFIHAIIGRLRNLLGRSLWHINNWHAFSQLFLADGFTTWLLFEHPVHWWRCLSFQFFNFLSQLFAQNYINDSLIYFINIILKKYKDIVMQLLPKGDEVSCPYAQSSVTRFGIFFTRFGWIRLDNTPCFI